MTTIRKGQVMPFVPREVFRQRFQQSFYDPAFDAERAALDRIENIAWDAYKAGRKAPRTVKAGDEFVAAGATARLDRFIGYYEPYATSHEALDRDTAVQEEVRNVARTLVETVGEIRAGRLQAPGKDLQRPRPK
jgi:hypothetical protein